MLPLRDGLQLSVLGVEKEHVVAVAPTVDAVVGLHDLIDFLVLFGSLALLIYKHPLLARLQPSTLAALVEEEGRALHTLCIDAGQLLCAVGILMRGDVHVTRRAPLTEIAHNAAAACLRVDQVFLGGDFSFLIGRIQIHDGVATVCTEAHCTDALAIHQRGKGVGMLLAVRQHAVVLIADDAHTQRVRLAAFLQELDGDIVFAWRQIVLRALLAVNVNLAVLPHPFCLHLNLGEVAVGEGEASQTHGIGGGC